MFLQGLKRFDVHLKAMDGVHQQNILGAVLTLVTTILVFVLLFSEISVFFKVDVVSRMVVDKNYGHEAVRLEFDLSFPTISCDSFTFTQEVTRGNIHLFESITEVTKVDIDNPDPSGFSGCRLTGAFLTDKVGGNFRFAITPQKGELNLSHTLNKVAFYPVNVPSAKDKLPDIADTYSVSNVEVPLGTGIYQYTITVVPTQYKTLYGDLSFLNQYSVVEKSIPVDYVLNFEAQNSMFLKDFQGIVFSYDFNPVSFSLYILYHLMIHFGSVLLLTLLGDVVYGGEKRTHCGLHFQFIWNYWRSHYSTEVILFSIQ